MDPVPAARPRTHPGPRGASVTAVAPARPAAGAAAAASPAVLVLSTAFRPGPWACRSLRAAGYRVVGASTEGRLAGGRSLACPRPLHYPPPARDPEGFVRAVREICAREDIDVVLPAAEDTARVLAELAPDLGGAAVVGPTREVYAALCDKGLLAETAARAGVDHPRTTCVDERGRPDGPLPEPPAIIKPRISGEDLGGLPAVIAADTVAARDAAIARYTARGLGVVVQERVTGQRWVAQSVRDAGGRLDLVATRIERDYPRQAGVASLMKLAAVPPAPVAEAVARLLGEVDYRGPSTISFIRTGDRWVVHDVNLRLGASVGLVIRAGLDMPRRAVEVALGRDPGALPVTRPYVYLRLDGEIGGIRDALRGRAPGESALRLTGDLMRGLIAPGRMVDPHPLEPFFVGRELALSVRRLAHRAGGAVQRRESRRRG